MRVGRLRFGRTEVGRTNLPRWVREPMVHFLAAGAALFALFAWQGEPADPASRTIDVSREDRARLALQYERTMQRPPTDAELAVLTEQFVREEVLYREALRLGLDRDDAVVRKRMANKMDFLAQSMAETAEPSDAELEEWRAEHLERFADDARLSFDQRFFASRVAAEAALRRLQAGEEVAGEPISLPATVGGIERARAVDRFGEAFVAELDAIEPGSGWRGPVASGFGWHAVRVVSREPGTTPPLAEIREQVENDWRAATMAQRRDEAYRLLRDAYDVSIAP